MQIWSCLHILFAKALTQPHSAGPGLTTQVASSRLTSRKGMKVNNIRDSTFENNFFFIVHR